MTQLKQRFIEPLQQVALVDERVVVGDSVQSAFGKLQGQIDFGRATGVRQEVYFGVPSHEIIYPALVFEQVTIDGVAVYRMKASDGVT